MPNSQPEQCVGAELMGDDELPPDYFGPFDKRTIIKEMYWDINDSLPLNQQTTHLYSELTTR